MPRHLFCNQFPVCLIIRLTGLNLHLPIGMETLTKPSVRGAGSVCFASTPSREVPNGDLHFALVVLKDTKISAARIPNCFWVVIGSGLSCFRSCSSLNFLTTNNVFLGCDVHPLIAFFNHDSIVFLQVSCVFFCCLGSCTPALPTPLSTQCLRGHNGSLRGSHL